MPEDTFDGLPEEENLFEHHKFIADEGQSPLRIDKFLIDRLPDTSRSKIQNAAKLGHLKVNDQTAKANHKVKPGDVVTVELPHPVSEFVLVPENIPLNVVFEDDTVCVINKQAGLVVHPGFGNRSGTLVNALVYHFENMPQNTQHGIPRPGLVHRLDKNTTGIMVVAKTEKALMHLSKQFAERTTERKYQALVWGDVKEEGTVDGHIGRSYKNRKVMDVFPDGDQGKHAVTHFKPLIRFGYISLVECKLETGRTHQIRAHMKSISHPLFNDMEYGGDKIMKGTTFTKYRQFVMNCFKEIPRQALHAKSLGFTHPETGEWMFFESELPEDMQEVMARWNNYTANTNH